MKKIMFWIILPLSFILLNNKAKALKRDTLIISADLYHSWPLVDDKILLDEPGFYHPFVNPGFELLYFNKSVKKGNIWAGTYYQRSRFGTFHYSFGRIQIQELSIPVIYKRPASIGKGNYVFTIGLYNGILMKTSIERYSNKYGWEKRGKEGFYNYSSDLFFTDFYFDWGCPFKGNLGSFNLATYFKYRINGTWINYYDRNIYLGIKLSYFINLPRCRTIASCGPI